ncbi:MAG: Hsp20/alpha crystallin family protein [Chlamydiota bacterium]
MKLVLCSTAAALIAAAPLAALCASAGAPTPSPADEPAAAPMMRPPVAGPWYGGDDPLMELRMMQDRINRIMEESFGRMGPRPPAQWALPALEYSPDIDLSETDKAFTVTCDLPGMEKDKIEVTFKEGNLILRGSREVVKEEGKGPDWYLHERSAGSFERVIPIGAEVKEAGIKAEYKNGVLTVTLPKAESAVKPGTKVPVL